MSAQDRPKYDADIHAASRALSSLCDTFERRGDAFRTDHAADYKKLGDAELMLSGNVNDPLDDGKHVDPAAAKALLVELRESFANVAAKEQQKSETAVFYRGKHRDKAERFTGYARSIDKILGKI